ncbi:MAG: inositol monophosphatase [Candidatus Hydrogenedentes bacterium]|nr:inositol monophosphatase [Candidatus Hydrogenedentota bacterium]
MSWESELDLARAAAALAGKTLCKLVGHPKKVLSAEGKDIKIQADRDAEHLILEKLGETEYPILAEESGEHGQCDTSDAFWVVDPLDGTMNFTRDLPMNCVSIALCSEGDPVLGVVYDFNRDECFHGIVGQGAGMNDAPISVSATLERSQAVLATGFPAKSAFDRDTLDAFVSCVQQFKKIRMLGTAALSLAYVACGRVDVYLEDEIMLWDVAAGIALVEAAGGVVDSEPSKRGDWVRKVRCAARAELFPGK